MISGIIKVEVSVRSVSCWVDEANREAIITSLSANLTLLFVHLTLGPFIREKISRGLHKTRKELFIRVRLILDANCSYK